MLWHLGSNGCHGNLSPPQKGRCARCLSSSLQKILMMLEKSLVFDSCRGLSLTSHEGEFESVALGLTLVI